MSIGPAASVAVAISSRTLSSRPRVQLHGQTIDLRGDLLGRLELAVGDDQSPRALGREPPQQGPADSPRPAGDDDVLSAEVHAATLCQP